MIEQATKDIAQAVTVKSTLKYMSNNFIHSEPHPLVSFVDNICQVIRACIKTMLLTGTYPLRSIRFKKKKTESPDCPLYQVEKEDTRNFVETFITQDKLRLKYMGRIKALLPNLLKIALTQALLDSRFLLSIHPDVSDGIRNIEQISRDMIFVLHINWTKLLDISKK